ncbi:hypothetical protein DLAC_07369 [Tieghemostelium lacteum]|uniref:G8 domain-containing protein n=1 Tax=Tieghemostelium lacteum TaxID=361077 RepID=A0A151ZCC7_TIELA|nr:hypothetical protein DLAC_07369 [Tieghemostelium lacteum]|eukprot:KYQ91602.1 hypothetical protein DLAC_07369 [Tieghemostelium lacteum]
MKTLIFLILFTLIVVSTTTDSNCPDDNSGLLKFSNLYSGIKLNNQDINITQEVLLDINPMVEYRTIRIFGENSKLVWKRNIFINLIAESILIYDGGSLIIGSETCRYRTRTYITLTGDSIHTAQDHTINGHHFGQKVIGVSTNGTLELHGDTPPITWTKLNETLFSGYSNSILTLHDYVDWEVATKQIIVSSTDYDEKQTEIFEMLNCPECKKNQVKIKAPPKYMHWGTITRGVDERAEVGLLSRYIVIMSRLGNQCQNSPLVCKFFPMDVFGGHIMIQKGFRNAHIEGIECFRMGQSHVLSRYPIHFHMTGRVDELGGYSKPAYVRHTSIYTSYSRCIVVHGTHGLDVSDNIAYDSIGHCFMMCDGIETMNTFRHNLGLLTKPGLLLPSDRDCEMCSTVTPFDFNGNPTSCSECNAVSTFWITNPNNTIVDNVAGGSAITGFWYVFPDYPVGESEQLGRQLNIRPSLTPVLEFRNNIAHSNLDGFQADMGLKLSLPSVNEPQQYSSMVVQRYKPRSISNDESSEPSISFFTGLTSYKNRWRGGWARSGHLVFNKCVFADNAIGFTFASEGTGPADPTVGQYMYDSLFVGETENFGQAGVHPSFRNRTNPFGENGNMPVRGFEVYDGTVHLENIVFSQFKQDNSPRNISAIGFFRFNDWQTSCKSSLKNIMYINVDQRIHFETSLVDGDKTSTFMDLDGTGFGLPQAIVVRNSNFYQSDHCMEKPNWNGLMCLERTRQIYVYVPSFYRFTNQPSIINYNKQEAGIQVIRDKNDDNLLSLTGIPNNNPRNQFLILIYKNHFYDIHFPHPTPSDLIISGRNWEVAEFVDIGICLIPSNGLDFLSVTKVIGNQQQPIARSNNPKAADESTYYYDRDSGMLYVRFYHQYNREGDAYCGTQGCEELHIHMEGPMVGKITGDCRTIYYPKLNVFSETLNRKFSILGSYKVLHNKTLSSHGKLVMQFTMDNSNKTNEIKIQCVQSTGCIPYIGIKYLELWLNPGKNSSNPLVFMSLYTPTKLLQPVSIQPYLQKDTWSLLRLPFNQLTQSLPTNSIEWIHGIKFNSTTQCSFFIDEISFVYEY